MDRLDVMQFYDRVADSGSSYSTRIDLVVDGGLSQL
jgi:hypothetical protein